jgi:uncharacterized protein YjaZ
MTDNIMTSSLNNEILSLRSVSATLAQYIIYNLYRILRPIRKKFDLTINEILVLNGIMLYNKYVSSSFSRSSIRRWNGYFNNNKSDYYVKSLLSKQCIEVSDKIKEQIRYKITQKGIDIISHIDQCYSEALIKFCEKNNIEL